MAREENTMSRERAEKDVISMARRLASLYYHFGTVLMDELGEEKARNIILKVIEEYGQESGREAREVVQKLGLPLNADTFSKGSDLPSVGWKTESTEYPDGQCTTKITYCPFGEYWLEKDAEELGRLYCFVDQAKYAGFHENLQCIHLKNVLDGDEYCELAVKERDSD